MKTTTVRSDLARADIKDATSARCPSTHTMAQTVGNVAKGTTLHCTRPASRHRVHEAAGWIQWEGR